MPFLAVYDCQQKMLQFGILKDVKVSDNDDQNNNRNGFVEDIVMDQNIAHGSGLSAVSGGANKSDPLLENPYTQSLLPMSRHPLFQLATKTP